MDVIFPVDCDVMGRFLQICISNSDEFALERNKYFRGNIKFFINKVKRVLLLKDVL